MPSYQEGEKIVPGLKNIYSLVKDRFNYIIKEIKIFLELYVINPHVYKSLLDSLKRLIYRFMKDIMQTLIDIKEFFKEANQKAKNISLKRRQHFLCTVSRFREKRLPIIKKSYNEFYTELKKSINLIPATPPR